MTSGVGVDMPRNISSNKTLEPVLPVGLNERLPAVCLLLSANASTYLMLLGECLHDLRTIQAEDMYGLLAPWPAQTKFVWEKMELYGTCANHASNPFLHPIVFALRAKHGADMVDCIFTSDCGFTLPL